MKGRWNETLRSSLNLIETHSKVYISRHIHCAWKLLQISIKFLLRIKLKISKLCKSEFVEKLNKVRHKNNVISLTFWKSSRCQHWYTERYRDSCKTRHAAFGKLDIYSENRIMHKNGICVTTALLAYDFSMRMLPHPTDVLLNRL